MKKPTVQELILKVIEALFRSVNSLPAELKATVLILVILVIAASQPPWVDVLRTRLA